MGVYKIIFKLFMFACLGFHTVAAHALALSEAELKSHLNQLLDVRIELKTDNAAEIDELKIELRSPLANYSSRYHLKYKVLNSDGVYILQITSQDVIREPIVEFILDIGWSDGHVIKEYSFLIDPTRN